jgi:hypothetical protein
MDLSGGPLGCDALALELKARPPRPSGRGDVSRKEPFLLVRQETEAQRPGVAGPRTYSVEGQERARTQASGFAFLDFSIPFHLSTLWDLQSKGMPLCPAIEVCGRGATCRP